MSEHTNELLSQYLDGELGASEVLELERALDGDLALRTRLEQMRSIDSSLRNAFKGDFAVPIPAHITQMLAPQSNVVAFPTRASKAKATANWGLAVAASLMAASGLLMFQKTQIASVDQGIDALIAQELEQAPSRASGWNLLADGREMRPVLSFYSKDNGWCREFLLSDQGAQQRGVACKSENQWVSAVMGPIDTQINDAATDYRPAGAADLESVQAFVDSQAVDIPLGLRAEAKLIEGDWK
jgi:hypothetical protein